MQKGTYLLQTALLAWGALLLVCTLYDHSGQYYHNKPDKYINYILPSSALICHNYIIIIGAWDTMSILSDVEFGFCTAKSSGIFLCIA